MSPFEVTHVMAVFVLAYRSLISVSMGMFGHFCPVLHVWA